MGYSKDHVSGCTVTLVFSLYGKVDSQDFLEKVGRHLAFHEVLKPGERIHVERFPENYVEAYRPFDPKDF